MATGRFSESHGIVPVQIPVLDNFNAGVTGDSVNMALYNHLTLIMIGNADCAGTPLLTIYGGTAVGGTDAAITFSYRYSTDEAKTAGGDVLGAWSTSVALTLTEASIQDGLLIVEIAASDLLIAGVQYQWVTPVLDAAGTDGEYAIIGILSEPRYAKNVMPTAI
jgi:hypothetical protein